MCFPLLIQGLSRKKGYSFKKKKSSTWSKSQLCLFTSFKYAPYFSWGQLKGCMSGYSYNFHFSSAGSLCLIFSFWNEMVVNWKNKNKIINIFIDVGSKQWSQTKRLSRLRVYWDIVLDDVNYILHCAACNVVPTENKLSNGMP